MPMKLYFPASSIFLILFRIMRPFVSSISSPPFHFTFLTNCFVPFIYSSACCNRVIAYRILSLVFVFCINVMWLQTYGNVCLIACPVYHFICAVKNKPGMSSLSLVCMRNGLREYCLEWEIERDAEREHIHCGCLCVWYGLCSTTWAAQLPLPIPRRTKSSSSRQAGWECTEIYTIYDSSFLFLEPCWLLSTNSYAHICIYGLFSSAFTCMTAGIQIGIVLMLVFIPFQGTIGRSHSIAADEAAILPCSESRSLADVHAINSRCWYEGSWVWKVIVPEQDTRAQTNCFSSTAWEPYAQVSTWLCSDVIDPTSKWF